MVQGHARWARSHGWTGNAWGRPGQNGSNRSSRWNGWGRNAWRWNGSGRNGWYWSRAGLYGFGYWPSPDAYASAATPPGGDGPPILIAAPSNNVYPPAEPASFDRAVGGGCVIHKLIYNADGKYVGEQQTPEC
jgi:hypothetical protein